MKHLILVAALALGMTGSAFAGELDNEGSVTNQTLNGTVVIRVDSRSNETSVLTTDARVANATQAQNLALAGNFTKAAAANVRGELDTDGGASSWYFYNGYNNYYHNSYYGYGSMNWYGNWYRPCYSYNYNYYNYYYYSNYWW